MSSVDEGIIIAVNIRIPVWEARREDNSGKAT
jgi:hypothetical protein